MFYKIFKLECKNSKKSNSKAKMIKNVYLILVLNSTERMDNLNFTNNNSKIRTLRKKE